MDIIIIYNKVIRVIKADRRIIYASLSDYYI